ncbi:MAG: MASE3 domain-containing protein [Candidatus Odinarchaeota archaeon]
MSTDSDKNDGDKLYTIIFGDKPQLKVLIGFLVLLALFLTSFYSFLLFHSLVELFSIIVACSIFLIAWNTRKITDNRYFLFIAIAYLFIGIIDLLHTLAYANMGVFPGYSSNLSVQLWIVARYTESISLLIAVLLMNSTMNGKIGFNGNVVVITYSVITGSLIAAVFTGLFPVCFIEGKGLTPFKIISEYIIIVILASTLVLMYWRRDSFHRNVSTLLASAIITTMGAELVFTFYASIFSFPILIGHLLKLISFYFIYKAIIESSLVKPYSFLYGNLQREKNTALRLVKDLNAANEDLKEFAYVVSHDLKAPLRAIGIAAEWLKMDYAEQLDAEFSETIDSLCSRVDTMNKLIDGILEYSRVVRFKEEVIELDVNELVKSVINLLSPPENIHITIETPLPVILAERNRIAQIFQNLIDNAIKFMDKTAGKIGISCEEYKEDNGYWLFSIADNGPGIEEEHQETIFELFQKISSSNTNDSHGIGLSIAKKIVEMYGGRIWVESTVNEGSTFFFTFPKIP